MGFKVRDEWLLSCIKIRLRPQWLARHFVNRFCQRSDPRRRVK